MTLTQRKTLHEFNARNRQKDFYGDVIAAACVILMPFLVWVIGSAF